MNVIQYPYYGSKNPYQDLMSKALDSFDINTTHISEFNKLIKRMTIGNEDILHLHWIDGLLRINSLSKCFFYLIMLYCSLMIFRLRGKKIIWTVHNLMNHEKQRKKLDLIHSKIVARLAHQILTHGEYAKKIVANKLNISEKKINVLYHGNYEDIIEPSPCKNRYFNINFLFFGMIRSYKGLPSLLDSFIELKGDHQLQIVGIPKDIKLRKLLEEKSQFDPRIKLNLNYVDDRTLQKLLNWCDFVVLPYKEIFTSGSLLMAISAGRPVIVPKIGVIPEYVNKDSAIFYNPEDKHGLTKALNEAIVCDDIQTMSQEALKQSKLFRWKAIAEQLVKIYIQ